MKKGMVLDACSHGSFAPHTRPDGEVCFEPERRVLDPSDAQWLCVAPVVPECKPDVDTFPADAHWHQDCQWAYIIPLGKEQP